MSEGIGQPRIGSVEEPSQPFKPASWSTKIDFIKQLILGNNVLISILGEQNGGKTTFATFLATTLSPTIKSILVTANPLFSLDDLLNQIGEKLTHKGEMSLANFINESQETAIHTLVIIDDAHFLPNSFVESTLEALKQQDKSSYFHICLVSNYSLAAALNNLGTQHYQDMVHSIELGPLTEKETASYVREQLQFQPGIENSLTHERIKQFHQLTEGNIVGINTQMTAYFNHEKPMLLPKSKIRRNIAATAAVLIVVFGSAYLWNTNEVQSIPAQNVAIVLPQPMPDAANSQNSALQASAAAPVTVAVEDTAFTSSVPSYTLASTRQELQATSLRRINLVQDEANLAADDSMVVMDKVVIIPKHIKVEPAKQIAIAKPTVKPVVKPTAVRAAVSNVDKFTIQLLASQSKADLLRFAKVNSIDAKVFRTQNHGKSWYVLTYGQYKGRDAAKQAISHLPKSLAKLKPWVREVNDLKVG